MIGHKSCILLTLRMTLFQVILEMCFLNKTCFTIVTWKRFLSSVGHNVCRKVTLSIEIFSANVTWKWFSSCMGQNMILHISEHMHYSRAKWAAIFSRSKSNGIFFMIFLDFFGSIWFTSCIRTDFGPICIYHLNEQFMKSWKTRLTYVITNLKCLIKNIYLCQEYHWIGCKNFLWVLTLLFWVNLLPQISHWKAFSPVWTTICLLACWRVPIIFGQRGHPYW